MTAQDSNIAIGVEFGQPPEAPPSMVNGTLTDGADLGSAFQVLAATYNDLWMGFADAHLRCGNDLIRDLAACKTGEEVLNAYAAYAASTLRRCESDLAALVQTGARVGNRTVGAGLQSVLAARPTFELPANTVRASAPHGSRSANTG